MSIKKKLGMGVASAALGLSLVGGGTYAYFNDTETIKNSFAAGTLDLAVVNLSQEDQTHLIELTNLKPGDSIEREFSLQNAGSLAIKDVLMGLSLGKFSHSYDRTPTEGAWDDDAGTGTNRDNLAFLDQFVVNILTTGAEGQEYDLITSTQSNEITLADLYKATNTGYTGADKGTIVAAVKSAMGTQVDKYWEENDIANPNGNGRINIASSNGGDWESYDGVPIDPADFDDVLVQITFKDSGDATQNVYQGNSIAVNFDLEARQWNGVESLTNDYTSTENEEAHPTNEEEPVTQP